jgi:hypothetical protein
MATSFDIGGLLGGAFGGGLSGIEDLLTPEQRAAIQRQAGLSAAAALLQAAGPSTTRTSLGQALGSAFAAGQAGAQKAQESALQQMLMRQKLEEAQRVQGLQKSIADILKGGAAAGPTVTPEQALAAPGMAPGPTVERAALVGQQRPQVNQAEQRAQQYRQIADVYAASGRAEDAKRYMDIAENLSPSRQEVVGQPFEVTGPEGRPVMVQQFKDGTIKTMAGFGPKREVVLQNVGDRIVAVNKSELSGGEALQVGMTPAERERLNIERENLGIARQRLNLSQAEFNRGAYDRMETDQGVVYVPKTPGFPVIPVTDVTGGVVKGAGAKPSEGESNAAGFAQRMERVNLILSKLPAEARPSVLPSVAAAVPLVGGVAQRKAETTEQQQYRQAADDWIRAKLRKESGAAIGKDEMEQEYRTYFPQIGDSEDVIRQKKEAREVATNAMRLAAGRAYTPYTAPKQTTTPTAQEGATSKDRQGRAIVYRNGRWEYQ